jgi:hypothetical protein
MERTLVVIVPRSFELANVRRILADDPTLTIPAADARELEVRSTLEGWNYAFVSFTSHRDLAIADYRDNDELEKSFGRPSEKWSSWSSSRAR